VNENTFLGDSLVDSTRQHSLKAIVNGIILCPVNGHIENGTVVFDEKRIHAVGKDVKVPDDAEVIDAKGLFVVPGFIDPHAHHGLFQGTIGRMGMDGNEMTNPTTPEMRGIDGFNPHEDSLKEIVQGGVTTVNTGPGSGNVIGGECLVFKPTGADLIDDMVILSPSGLKIALGENPKRIHGVENKRTPSTRMGVAAMLRKTLTEGQNYLDEWAAFGAKAREAKDKDEAPPKPPKRDIGLETIAKVLKLIHCTEGHKIADYIAKKGIPAVVGPTLLWASKAETKERRFKTVVDLVKAGAKVALQTDSLTPMNYFPLLPMYAIKEGLSPEEALRCVTLNAAEILRIEDRVGSLEKGKDADIVIWSGNPFEFYSKPKTVFINGKEIPIE
jgi:imidazolonepropionase-like amidohydrolase